MTSAPNHRRAPKIPRPKNPVVPLERSHELIPHTLEALAQQGHFYPEFVECCEVLMPSFARTMIARTGSEPPYGIELPSTRTGQQQVWTVGIAFQRLGTIAIRETCEAPGFWESRQGVAWERASTILRHTYHLDSDPEKGYSKRYRGYSFEFQLGINVAAVPNNFAMFLDDIAERVHPSRFDKRIAQASKAMTWVHRASGLDKSAVSVLTHGVSKSAGSERVLNEGAGVTLLDENLPLPKTSELYAKGFEAIVDLYGGDREKAFENTQPINKQEGCPGRVVGPGDSVSLNEFSLRWMLGVTAHEIWAPQAGIELPPFDITKPLAGLEPARSLPTL